MNKHADYHYKKSPLKLRLLADAVDCECHQCWLSHADCIEAVISLGFEEYEEDKVNQCTSLPNENHPASM